MYRLEGKGGGGGCRGFLLPQRSTYVILRVIRIVNAWNNLPKDVVHAGSLTLFRNRLKMYMNID